jgi:hypothetical protein
MQSFSFFNNNDPAEREDRSLPFEYIGVYPRGALLIGAIFRGKQF